MDDNNFFENINKIKPKIALLQNCILEYEQKQIRRIELHVPDQDLDRVLTLMKENIDIQCQDVDKEIQNLSCQSAQPVHLNHIGLLQRQLLLAWASCRSIAARRRIEDLTVENRMVQIYGPENERLHTFASGHVSTALAAVRERSLGIANVEKSMIETAELFEDLQRVVQLQEPVIDQIAQSAEVTRGHVEESNKELEGARVAARNSRRWKWWLVFIIVLIIIVAGVLWLAVHFSTKA